MTSERRPLLAGNWKMNGIMASLEEVDTVARALSRLPNAPEVLVCPPATLIASAAVKCLGTPLKIGGQDCSCEQRGAFTGDLSASMLAGSGAAYVIVGHSERRMARGDTDEIVLKKVQQADKAGLRSIVCVGETGEERRAGRAADVVEAQLRRSLSVAPSAGIDIAYEPIWSIGTGLVPADDEIGFVHALIRKALDGMGPGWRLSRILYGGSVKPDNARGLLSIPNVDGALVGGASLVAKDFLAIAEGFPH